MIKPKLPPRLCLAVLLAVLSFSNASVASKEPADESPQELIQNLIRQMLKWSDSNASIDLLPTADKDGICVGFDFALLNQNLGKLRETGLFAEEFIENYKCIIESIDKKVKSKNYPEWNCRESLPAAYGFMVDASPWCSCQDNLSWDIVQVEVVELDNDKGEMKWNWGKLDSSYHHSWTEFSYTFRVKKVNNKWKIAYLEGFDYAGCTKQYK